MYANIKQSNKTIISYCPSYPNVGFGGDGESAVEVDHLGGAVGERRVLLDVVVHDLDPELLRVLDPRRRRAEVAQHEVSLV